MFMLESAEENGAQPLKSGFQDHVNFLKWQSWVQLPLIGYGPKETLLMAFWAVPQAVVSASKAAKAERAGEEPLTAAALRASALSCLDRVSDSWTTGAGKTAL
ncbi:MAG: hypothetical protein JSW27_03135 [Phycisphaerales bacterium]|nr:MAG: hypothetical protein JSW27_03135 [Phycisphaerales bacterium]